jgi:NodT family efflux transporter outer membrane factor (OMF) lipoprotein
VAQKWIDADDVRIRSQPEDDSHWWTVFNDAVLNDLVQTAYRENLTLREAGFRVLQARASLGIAIGELFPQTQDMVGGYTRRGVSVNVANRIATPQRWFSTWDYGFGLAWEMDFWGRFRRAVEAADDTLNASVENYDDVLVLLISDVASDYVRYRVLEQQLAYTRAQVKLQTDILEVAKAKFKGGQVSELDVNQAQANLSATLVVIPQLEIALREVNDQLCILLGLPAEDLKARLGAAAVPTAPTSVAVGIPADLLRRRPDVRRAERQAAAQSAEIGVAEADFYPQISLDATWGWSAQELKDLFASGSFRGSIGPAFRWQILNYGRILNNVRLQDARFQELVATYQQTVLKANGEVEDGLARFIKAQDERKNANDSVVAQLAAVKDALAQYKGGLTDFNRVAVIEEQLVQRQNQLAQAEGDIALGLIQVYRALGGGWQIRCDANASPANCAAPTGLGVAKSAPPATGATPSGLGIAKSAPPSTASTPSGATNAATPATGPAPTPSGAANAATPATGATPMPSGTTGAATPGLITLPPISTKEATPVSKR